MVGSEPKKADKMRRHKFSASHSAPAGRWVRSVTLLALFVAVVPATAEEPIPQKDAGSERLQAMAGLAKKLTLKDLEEAGVAPAELIAGPLVRYDDQPRKILDGSLWAFGRHGRPIAALKVELYPGDLALYGVVSLCPTPINAEGNGLNWSSSKPAFELRPIPDAPTPGATERDRLTQMKTLSRRFSGFELDVAPRGRLQMRLMPKPVHRYSEPGAGIQDGAIFSLANGTNPEVLIVIESRTTGTAKTSTWQYGLARLGGAELVVMLDDRQVWREPAALPPAVRETYVNRVFPYR